jgi:hypothetical protein
MKRIFVPVLAVVMLVNLGLVSVSSVSAARSSYDTATFPFGTHITMGLPEQDVFVKHGGSSQDQVFRVSPTDAKDSAVLDQPVYAAGAMQQHDPFGVGPNPMGPYPAGEPLGFTLRQWLSAGGDVTYGCANGRSTVSGSLHNLVPNGQYTLLYSRLTFPPNLNVVNRPLGAADGSQNSFKADTLGNATFNIAFAGCLEETSKETATLIVTAYHSDGKTYGSAPGDFGLVTHLQNVAVIAPPAAPSPSGNPGMPSTGAGSAGMSGAGGIVGLAVALLGLLIGAYLRRRAHSS